MTEDNCPLYPAIQRDATTQNISMQEQEVRGMLMLLMFRRAVRGAGQAT